MTTNNPTRRGKRSLGYAASASRNDGDQLKVGDRLRDLREARGLDLYRVERDTKIRHKFLVALEAGDYADLPGDVYARGFLRNYATYLGLDPDEIIEEWRRESGTRAPVAGPPTMLGAPRPMVLPRRGFFLQTSHMVLIAVVLIVAIVGAYFGYQVTRFLSYPTLSVGCPGSSASVAASGSLSASGAISAASGATTGASPTAASGSATPQLTVLASGAGTCEVAQGAIHITTAMGATTYYISGTATTGSSVTIVWNKQEPKVVPVDDGGHWSYQAVLAPGQNRFDVTAQGIDANHTSKTSTIYIFVPTPTPTPAIPVVAFVAPADGASFTDGKVTVSGTSSFVSDVTLTTTYLGVPPAPGTTLSPGAYSTPAPGSSAMPTLAPTPTPASSASTGPTPSSSIPAAPPPVTSPVDSNGDFTFPSLVLDPGVWRLSITGEDAQSHKSATLSRVVSVPFTGVAVVIRVQGAGGSWMRYFRDGVALGQSTYASGFSVSYTAKKNACVLAGKPSNVYLTVNGVDVGTVATFGGTHVLIDATNGPKNVANC